MDERGCWQAVMERNRGADGSFVYAVRSTGIYCRPSCPSRRPRREQVVFFEEPGAAERAGFRPCRRCRPLEKRDGLVERVCRYIETHLEEDVKLGALAGREGISAHHLLRTFKRALGITPRQYADARRFASLKSSLRKTGNVADAVYAAGYGSSSRVYERSESRLGMTPGTYRKGGIDMRIHYTIVNSPMGRLLVGATDRGVCAVSLGDSDPKLETFLRDEYPNAEISRNRNGMSRWVGAILEHLRGRQPQLDLPVDVQATVFQCRVWEELRAIPYGATRSYSEVARAIGRPTATRAVARACATNPVSIVIPCHRVLREDGNLGGYRWGIERKRALIAQEHSAQK
jgi:AraC family transcriptional regulator of adaptative response/methylated-DNA-[protein]-cysteine methyltransferase